jgi:hypothetical protein
MVGGRLVDSGRERPWYGRRMETDGTSGSSPARPAVVGRVIGTDDATPLEIWVGVAPDAYLQLDDVVALERELPDGSTVRQKIQKKIESESQGNPEMIETIMKFVKIAEDRENG